MVVTERRPSIIDHLWQVFVGGEVAIVGDTGHVQRRDESSVAARKTEH